MSPNKFQDTKMLVYDFFKEKAMFFLLGGYSESRSVFYILYILCLFTSLIYLTIMAAYGAYVCSARKDVIMDALHVASITLFSTWGLASRIFTGRTLRLTSDMINEGIFHYEGEDMDEEELKMKMEIPGEIRRKSAVFVAVFTSGLTVNMVVFPLSQLLLLEDDDPRLNDDIVNPFLPPVYFFYNPFNTKSFYGYTLAYLLVILLLVSVYGVNTCMTEIYLACTAQLKIHSKILNHSIINIQKRALKLYIKKTNIAPQNVSVNNLFENEEFQKCWYTCFKANVQHHQALLRFKNACQPFCGAILLDTVTVALLCYAADFYLVIQVLPFNYTISYTVLLMTEQTYTFYICLYGEEVIEESSQLFDTLYDIPWFNCNKSFSRTFTIMKGYAMKPFSMRALLLDVAASLETYGTLVATVYKIMNLLRQSDVIRK